MPSFEYITILIEYGSQVKTPVVCKGCDTYYTIYNDGLVTYTTCCESKSLDPEYDEEHIKEVIEILQQAIELIKKKYNWGLKH